MIIRTAPALLTLAAAATPALGQASFTYLDVVSDGGGNGSAFTETLPSFTVQSLSWTGTNVSSNGGDSFLGELLVGFESPVGGPALLQGGVGGAWDGLRNTSGWSSVHAGTDAAGDWTFSFDEEFDDPGVDAVYESVTINVNDVTFPGAIPVGDGTVSTPISTGELLIYTFNHAGGFASFSTLGSTLVDGGGGFADDDTEMAVFDMAGNLLAENDDEDFANDILTSYIEFGDLPAGQYAIFVGAFNTAWDDRLAVTSHDAEGTIQLTVVPAPSALLPLAAIALIRRRR